MKFEEWLHESATQEMKKAFINYEKDHKHIDVFRLIFEDGQKNPEWIPGLPDKKSANFLLKVKPGWSDSEHVVKAFYAEKFQIDAWDPDGEYDPDIFEKDENDEYYLPTGFYENKQLYNDESYYCRIPEYDIIAWMPLPKA